MEKLTKRERAFVREYLLCRNGAEAARRAGYAEKSARVTASQLLTKPNIQAAIQAGEKKVELKFEVTQEAIIKELARIAFFDLKNTMKEVGRGVELKDWWEMDENVSSAIQSVTETHTAAGGSYGVKGYDKIKALELLGKHVGLWKEGNAAKGTDSNTRATVAGRLSQVLAKTGGRGTSEGSGNL